MSRKTDAASPSERRRLAGQALDELGKGRDEVDGLVFEALVGPHAHGYRDFIDTAHHGTAHGTRFVDFLDADAFADDLLPARCECGTHELSRAELQRAVQAHQRTIFLS